MQLVGFIIKIYHDARSPERQIKIISTVFTYVSLTIVRLCEYRKYWGDETYFKLVLKIRINGRKLKKKNFLQFLQFVSFIISPAPYKQTIHKYFIRRRLTK